MGNEMFLNELPERDTQTSTFSRQDALAVVAQAYRQAKELDPTRLVHASDGGTPQPHTDVVSAGGWEPYGPKPYLLHEYGTYTCSLPDFSLIPRLNGVIRPLTYERAERYVREHELEAVYPRLHRSSLLMRPTPRNTTWKPPRPATATPASAFGWASTFLIRPKVAGTKAF